MKPDRNCPSCGKVLPRDAPAGHCPNCLVRMALEAANADTASPDGAGDPPASHAQPDAIPKVCVKYFGDYLLTEEIARGGMGVVWKARQSSLNRSVALKMILAGRFAGDADVKRFQTEAEAAANLQHPNIVAIHEVGEHEGQHYFSMDYVEGRNLAEMVKGGPMPVAKAAALVKTIAEAIHYAHLRGTLHRDLKPSNVLIDASGQPRITDFGLAKQLMRDDGLTETGATMGTPAYMPPEQALGKKTEFGPPSDVYSIGAILYELLTGRAPFAGGTGVGTLRMVLEEAPVSPSRLNPKTPCDLETICLKCLEKRPERRYPTARALAEELERFLNHLPIHARPAGKIRKAWSWSLHHPWVITGVASLLVLGLIGFAYGLWEQNNYLIWERSHPGYVRRPGTISEGFLFRTLVGGGLMWAMILTAALFHRYSKNRQAGGRSIHRAFLLAYAILGIAGVVSGVDFDLTLIRAHVRENFSLFSPWQSVFDKGPYSVNLSMFVSRLVAEGSFGVAGLCLIFVPIWWGATMLWTAVRHFEPGMSDFRASERPARILGFTEAQLEFSKLSLGGLFTISLWLAFVPVYMSLASSAERRTVYSLAGVLVWMAGFVLGRWQPVKVRFPRVALLSITALVAMIVVFVLDQVFPRPVQFVAYIAFDALLSGLSGAALGVFILRRRKGVKDLV